MKRIVVLLFVVLVLIFSLGFSMPSVDKNIPQGQETCPKDGNWYKVDNLSGCSYDFSIPTGCYVTAYCYKAATYCSGAVPVNPPVEGVFHLVLNPCPHDLSHASFYVDCSITPTPTPTEPPVDPTPTPTEPPVDPTPTPTEPTQPQPTPDVIIPPTGGNGNPVLYYTVGGSILFLLGCTLLTFFRSKRKEV